MPKYIEISPLSPAITKAKVREVFKPFVTENIFVTANKAYIKFSDPNDVDSLYMKYDDDCIPQLDMARIIALPDDYDGSYLEKQESPEQETKVQNFIMSEKKQQSKSPSLKPIFIVIAQCDSKAIQKISQDAIKHRIFGKFKIGRVIKYKRDVYSQFLDPNQTELIQVSFPGGIVSELGPTATIDVTDPNFSYETVKKQIQIYEREKKIQKQKQQALKKERERKQAAALQDAQRRLSREADSQRFSTWSVRPESQLAEMVKINTQNTNPQLFWTLIVIVWGVYVIFM